jgi:hypothetical protein
MRYAEREEYYEKAFILWVATIAMAEYWIRYVFKGFIGQ